MVPSITALLRPVRVATDLVPDPVHEPDAPARSPTESTLSDSEATVVSRPNATRSRRSLGTHPIRWISLCVSVAMITLGVVAFSSPPAAQYDAYSPLIGHRAPGFGGDTLSNVPFNLSAERGHYVIIDFFASWCVPCRQEQPQLVSFARDHLGGAQLVGVIFHDSVSSVRSLLGPWIGLYPVLNDPGGQIASNYGVGLPPIKFLIDPHGKVVAKILGPVTETGLDDLIAKARSSGR